MTDDLAHRIVQPFRFVISHSEHRKEQVRLLLPIAVDHLLQDVWIEHVLVVGILMIDEIEVARIELIQHQV